ncbi:hypothetical protein D9M69_374630 [compost metagenome]
MRYVDFEDVAAHAVLHSADRQLLVRIKVSPRMEHERYQRLRSLEHSSVEIDLSRLSLEDINDPVVFENAVLQDLTNRTWIRSLRGEMLLERATQELQAQADEAMVAWAAVRAEREALEAAQQRLKEEEHAERMAALTAHRKVQRETAAQRGEAPTDSGELWDARQRREDLIIATIMKAVQDWQGRGVECSACYLTNPPGTRFCLYCTSDASEMAGVSIPADVARTIHHRMRSSVKPERSIRAVPSLIVVPDL